MIRNLDKADSVTKLCLALGSVVFYTTGVINGPLAKTLMILGVIILVIFVVRISVIFFTRD